MIFPFHVTPVVEPAFAAAFLLSAILYGVLRRQNLESHGAEFLLWYSNPMRFAIRHLFIDGNTVHSNLPAFRSWSVHLGGRSLAKWWRD